MKDIYILGVSAFYHDSAVALLKNGEILAAAHEERFTRKKQDSGFPVMATKWCLEYSGKNLDDLEAVVFYDKPFLKFERLLETYYSFVPRGWRSFITAMPVWVKEKLFLKKLIKDELKKIGGFFPSNLPILFSEHHLSHAASAFYPSPFKEAAILTIDGVGEWATSSIGVGRENEITLLKELHFPHSLGLLYSAFTYYTGFKVNSGEYKLMGLAPYGNKKSERVKKYIDAIYEEMIKVADDGSLWMNMDYFDYATGLKMVKENKWIDLFGIPPRDSESPISQEYCDMALAIQKVTEDIVLKMAKNIKEISGCDNLVMAGGVALNCVANGAIVRSNMFKNIWIQPAAGDAGGALGAALVGWYIYFKNPRDVVKEDSMSGAYLGPEFCSLDIEQTARKYGAIFEKIDGYSQAAKKAADLISQGNVVGWFQGRMEWGPRALGNRSIIADPRNREMQKKLNLKIKFREGFRPFAPSVLWEDAREYFDTQIPSPYMLLVADVVEKRRLPLPENYETLTWQEKLYHMRSDIPSVTHLDYSARLQTVHKNTNPLYWELINEFKKLTGYGVVVNTSFNVRGEPIVCTPNDAYKCFMRTDMDYLVMGEYLFEKNLNQIGKKIKIGKKNMSWTKDYEKDTG